MAKSKKRKSSTGAANALKKMKRAATAAMRRASAALGGKKTKRKSSAKKRAGARKAAKVSALVKDISEYLADLELAPVKPIGLQVAYHCPCSLQHGQKIAKLPKTLLASAGFGVKEVPEGHLCCGSAGTYNLLQPELAAALRDRKLANIALTRADLVAAGNIGCITQLAGAAPLPIVHTVELLDWATGGPRPAALAGLAGNAAAPAAGSPMTEPARSPR